MTETIAIPPVVKSVHVNCGIEHAFEVFTREIGSWWPLDDLALHPGEVSGVTWEERVGGEVFETSTSGERSHWATVVAWDPPTGFTLAWHVDPEAIAPTEIDVRFAEVGDGTDVVLEHRHWERLGATASTTRDNYNGGWEMVLGRYVARFEA